VEKQGFYDETIDSKAMASIRNSSFLMGPASSCRREAALPATNGVIAIM
jgi:hypothetical protein